MKKTSENKNIKIGVIISYISIVLNLLVHFVFLRFVNKNPDGIISHQYDLYSFAASISAYLETLSLGLSSCYIRFATLSKKENGEQGLKKTNGSFAFLFLAASIAALIISVILIILMSTNSIGLGNYSLPDRNIILFFFVFSSLNIIFGFVTCIFTLYLNYNTRFIFVRLLALIVSFLSPIISMPLIQATGSFVAYGIVCSVMQLISLVSSCFFAIRFLKYKATFKFDKDYFIYIKQIMAFTSFVFIVDLVVQFDANIDKILLGFFSPSVGETADASAVGYYNISLSLVSHIGVACSAVYSAYVPRINRLVVENKDDEINKTFLNVSNIALFIFSTIFCGFLSCGLDFVNAWLGPKKITVFYLTSVLLFIQMIPYTINLSSEIQRAKNLHKFRTYVMLFSALSNLVFSLTVLFLIKSFVPQSDDNYIVYQIVGCVSVTLVSTMLCRVLIMCIYNQKKIGLNIVSYFKCLLLNLIPPLIIAIAINVFSHFVINNYVSGHVVLTLIKGGAFLLFYLIFVVAFRRRFILSFFSKNNKDYLGESNEKPRILFINTFNRFSTGNCVKRLKKACEEHGYQTMFIYGRCRDKNDKESIYFSSGRFLNFCNNVFVKISGLIGHAHYFETKAIIKRIKLFNPNIIHLHNIHGNYINFKLLFDYLKDKNVVITMHDCFWLTGRCAHFIGESGQCNDWIYGCKKCKHKDYRPATIGFDKCKKLAKEKLDFITKNKNIVFIPISHWSAKMLASSTIGFAKYVEIPNGIKMDTFNRQSAACEKIILLAVAKTWDYGKGIDELNYLADNLDDKKYCIIAIGNVDKHKKLSNKITHIQYADQQIVFDYMKKASLFINPTHVDTFPTVLIECLHFSLPIISFDVGGCSQIIGNCGLCVNTKEEMLEAINKNVPFNISNDAFNVQLKKFSFEEYLKKHLELYDSLLK